MYTFINVLIISILLIRPFKTENICKVKCQCSDDFTRVNCDTKQWTNLNDVEFPSNVATLTLNHNNLKFDTTNDLSKIENLLQLNDLSLNQNPLVTIPSFNHTQLRTLSLQQTFLTSAKFPSSYNNSRLQRITLNNNNIRVINEKDFSILYNSQLTTLRIDSSTLSKIDQNAMGSLVKLQSLSLNNNQLTSCEFLSNARLLSSIQLDGNQFTSLPPQLTMPGNIKTYSFRRNLISVIDDSSPLFAWAKANLTNVKISLANNTFDCCSSIWFIRFLKSSPQFVADASSLQCSTPLSFAEQFLVNLNPDDMNCNGDIPSKPWWTNAYIIGSFLGWIVVVLIITIVVRFIIPWVRRQQTRADYEPLNTNDNADQNVRSWLHNVSNQSIPEGHPDRGTVVDHSDTRTEITRTGVGPVDENQVEYERIEDRLIIPAVTA